LRGFFQSIPWFLNWFGEWHAVVQGFADGFCPWPARHKMHETLFKEVSTEHHYYNGGRAVGFAALLVLVAALIRWIL